VYEPLMALLDELARDGTQVLCLQEVYDAPEAIAAEQPLPNVQLDLLIRLRQALPNYRVFFAVNSTGLAVDGRLVHPDQVRYGNALLVRDDVHIADYRVHPIIEREYPVTGLAKYVHTLQVVDLRIGGCPVKVGNFHGLPWPGDKFDTPARIVQSKRLLQVAGDVHVLCGDFNLDPRASSVALLEAHWRNLIREFQVPSTRSRLNPFWGTPREQRFADYAFVSESIAAERFSALDAQVSDHLGLLLEARLTANTAYPPPGSEESAA
jgi:endonuclease/exonuclease/phosphatase family metal-dependent hydrolase